MAILPKLYGESESEESEESDDESSQMPLTLEQKKEAIKSISKYLKKAIEITKFVEMDEMAGAVEVLDTDAKYLENNIIKITNFQKELSAFMAKVIMQVFKYQEDSEDHDPEKLKKALICQKFTIHVKARFALISENLSDTNSLFALCDDIPKMQAMINKLSKTLD